MAVRAGSLVLAAVAAGISLAACGTASPPTGAPAAVPPPTVALPTAVETGMHVVQVVGSADPILSQVQAALEGGGALPSSAEVRAVSATLQQFAGVASSLPAVASDGGSVRALGAASATVGETLAPLARRQSLTAQARASLLSSIATFRAVAARAGRAVGAAPAG